MSVERWQQVEKIFQAALDHAPGERAAYLDEACAGDENLRREVEAFLNSYKEAESFIETPALEIGLNVLTEKEDSLSRGETLGSYRVIERLGAGGMGEVYLAEDERLGRKVALKLLSSRFTQSPEQVRRFRQEARAASGLNHPNILTVHEVGTVGDKHFIATEYVKGKTLRQLIANRSLELPETLDVVAQMATALAAAHAAGIVHRDIKPENIMLRDDGYVKVLDFGIAKLAEGGAHLSNDTEAITKQMVQTEPGRIIGTVKYMSPEQARGLAVDQRTDIWSLGVVFYEMVTGHTPFEGETPSDVIANILHNEPQTVQGYVPNAFASRFQRIIEKSLTKSRDDRYQTIKNYLDDLSHLKKSLSLQYDLESVGSEIDDYSSVKLNTGQQEESVSLNAHGADNQGITFVIGNAQKTMMAKDKAEHTGEMPLHTTSGAEYLIGEIKRNKTTATFALLSLVLTVAVVAFVLYSFVLNNSKNAQGDAQLISSGPFLKWDISRLTDTGNAISPAISPDGKYLAYLTSDGKQDSIWVKHLPTDSAKQIFVSDEGLNNLAFSPDGNFIYYVSGKTFPATVYRVTVVGAAPRKIVDDVWSHISLSPDNQRIAFIRLFPENGEYALVVANIDGTGEQKIASRKEPEYFHWKTSGPAWSPRGQSIACVVADANGKTIVEFDLKDGSQKNITAQNWTNIENIAWFSYGSGLIITARDKEGFSNQVWYVSYFDGKARRITNDLNNYRRISFTADSKLLVVEQEELVSSIWVTHKGDSNRAKQITFGASKRDGDYGLVWTQDGKLIYSSGGNGRFDIWGSDEDGANQKQLTVNMGSRNYLPTVSPDRKRIAFVSNRAGSHNIWTMNADGQNPKQLTFGKDDIDPAFTPDGKWVMYIDNASKPATVWKVSADGGEPLQVNIGAVENLSLSPDGKWLAYVFVDAEDKKRRKVAVAPLDGGEPVKVFPYHYRGLYRWTPDGKELAYMSEIDFNIWIQPLDNNPPRQVTRFQSERTYWFAWSHDGKQLALARGQKNADAVVITDSK